MKIKLLAMIIMALFAVIQTSWAHEGAVLIKELAKGNDYQPLIEGGKESVKMESGRVVKLRGQKGTTHSTKNYEEILIISKGKGTVNIEGKDHFVKEGDILYIPPHHNHQVTNNGSRKLEYIYVATPAVEK